MSEVKRYEVMFKGGTNGIGAHGITEMVNTSDYDALASQRDEGLAREAELQKEVERLRGLPHGQILAEAAAKHLLDSGAENFVGEVFTIDADDGQTSFEIVVTTQKVGAKSPGEVCNELQQLLAEATDLLKHMTSSYHRALENGYDRIIFLGGDCDSVAKMEADDPYYANARAFLASPGCADGENRTERGSEHGFEQSPNSCRHDEKIGVWWRERGVTRTGRECVDCGHVDEDGCADGEK